MKTINYNAVDYRLQLLNFMPRKPKSIKKAVDPNDESIRGIIANSLGEDHVTHRSLTDAKQDPEGVVVFEGDYGGQIYLVVRASFILCSEVLLSNLLNELDALGWADSEGARIYFESLPIGSGVAGGMGGGLVGSDIWLHPELGTKENAVRNVLLGQSASIHQ